MTSFRARYWLNFDADIGTEPVLWEMSKKFDVIFNVRQATLSENMGVMAVILEGERGVVQAAVEWLEQRGVRVEPVEINTIEG